MLASRLSVGVLAGSVAGVLFVSQIAMAGESGSFRIFQSLVYDFTTIEHPGMTTTAGSLTGTSTILESSGEPFVSGANAVANCVVYGKQSESSLELEAPCTVTDGAGDRWFFVAKRGAGDMQAGGGGDGRIEFLGGTGKYAGVTGSCPYETEYLSDHLLVAFGDCVWQRP